MIDHGSRPWIEELIPAPDPVICCERLAGLPYRVLFDSALRSARLGRYSFLAADPALVIRAKGARVERIDLVNRSTTAWAGDALEAIETYLTPFRTNPVADVPPFQGGAAGYLAYDWGRTLERLPPPRYDDLELPDVVVGIYDWAIAWDHSQDRTWLISTGIPERTTAAREQRAHRRARAVLERLNAETIDGAGIGRAAVREPALAPPSFPVTRGWWDSGLAIRSSFDHASYLEAVSRVRDYIFSGDIFQANLSQRFEAPLTESPWSIYRRLRERNAAPFAAYLDLPDATVLSASPERFLRVEPDGRVETRPIKGTRPRGPGPDHDAALGRALSESAKDRAENLMIVDLMRNDLSRVCEPGTVRVSELFGLEQYATVQHLVSTVNGNLSPGRHAFDLMRAAFPGGSVTGAPKVRAMEVIAELEPSARSVYCGTIAYWSTTGALDSSIAIRTAISRHGRVYFNAGGGIVADSDPEMEYRETLDKARGIIDALTPA